MTAHGRILAMFSNDSNIEASGLRDLVNNIGKFASIRNVATPQDARSHEKNFSFVWGEDVVNALD